MKYKLKTTDQIISSEACRGYARALDPINGDELFHIAWLKIREKELREEI